METVKNVNHANTNLK